MKLHSKLLRAASAALSILAFLPSGARAEVPAPCLPDITVPGEEEAFATIRRAYRFQLPETPQVIGEFIRDFSSSYRLSEARLMLADWYFFNQEFPSALNVYSEIRDDAFSADVRQDLLYRKAFCRMKVGFYKEARSGFRQLVSSGRYADDARFYLAYLDYVDGNYDAAYRQFQTIKSLGEKGAEAEYYLNQIDYRNGEFRKVANTSERLLSGAAIPDVLRPETMRVGGLSFFKLGDKTSARNILSRYVDLTGDGAEISALYALATIYYDEGDYERALPLFSTVTEYPGDLAQSAWLYIGQISLLRGDSRAAALAFDKAAKESWNGDVAETAAYNLAVSSTDGLALPFADAASAMENFIFSYPASPYASSLSSYLANAYYGRRDYEKALALTDKITPADDTVKAMRQKILYQLGVSNLQQGNTAAAIKALTEASASSAPDREVGAQAALWLGDALYASGDFSAAAKAYEKAISSGKLGDNTALANYNLGYAYMKLRNYRKAESEFKLVMDSKELTPPQKADARLRYADCLYYNDKYSQALAIFRDIKLGGGSDAVFAQIREADILGREGKVSDKISILESLAANPDAGVWRSAVLSRLADAYSEKGDDRKAAALYADILDNSSAATDNAQTYYSLATNAENLYNSGDIQAAYNAYKRLEKSGIAALYPSAVTGVMRTATDNAEIALYAEKVTALPGISAEEMDEALFRGAEAALALGGSGSRSARSTLESLALSSDRLWGARAAVILGEALLAEGDVAGAETILLNLIDNGSDSPYWLARGYIALSDVYSAQEKDYLARLYLETLQNNYPGNEPDISRMISSRLKALDK